MHIKYPTDSPNKDGYVKKDKVIYIGCDATSQARPGENMPGDTYSLKVRHDSSGWQHK